MELLILFITAALTIISLITITNVLFFPRLHSRKGIEQTPFVSVMIPARNEAQVIGKTLKYLLDQTYPNYEIILLDDNSDDDTGKIARAFTDSRLKILKGQPLPDGWMGKNWACHQMAQVAHGDYLVFTDADVVWSPDALNALIHNMQNSRADLYTIWPTQETLTWSERLCVPLMAVVVMGYLPIIGTHYVPLSVFGAANGQCMAWKRSAYDCIGGHLAVRGNVLEDVTLARMVKGAGMRLRMADGNRLISCRMYTDWQSVRNGYAKNILAGFGGVPQLIISTFFHLSIFVLPWLWLMGLFDVEGFPAWWPLALIMMGVGVRALTAAFTHQRLIDSIVLPASALLMTRIAAQAIWWHYRQGGPSWKGRVIRRNAATGSTTHG